MQAQKKQKGFVGSVQSKLSLFLPPISMRTKQLSYLSLKLSRMLIAVGATRLLVYFHEKGRYLRSDSRKPKQAPFDRMELRYQFCRGRDSRCNLFTALLRGHCFFSRIIIIFLILVVTVLNAKYWIVHEAFEQELHLQC